MDLLLHLLLNITSLPVTKAAIKDSGMGITIGTIGKHNICKDTPNEHAIKERINQLKDSWNSSVKARKSIEAAKETLQVDASKALSPPSDTSKREAPEAASTTTPVKRRKLDVETNKNVEQKTDAVPKKATLFNALLKTVKSGSPKGLVTSSKLHSKPKENIVASVSSKSISSTVKEISSNNVPSKRNNMKQGWFSDFLRMTYNSLFPPNFSVVNFRRFKNYKKWFAS